MAVGVQVGVGRREARRAEDHAPHAIAARRPDRAELRRAWCPALAEEPNFDAVDAAHTAAGVSRRAGDGEAVPTERADVLALGWRGDGHRRRKTRRRWRGRGGWS